MKPSIFKSTHEKSQNATDLVVVIDVLRSFTTAAYAFGAGASKILLAKSTEEALALQQKNPDYLLAGELNGLRPPGFHYNNSPSELAKADLNHRTLVLRSGAGTRSILNATQAKKILVSSFVIAEATFKEICRHKPKRIDFVIAGSLSIDEDLALADYLEKRLLGENVSVEPYLQRVIFSKSGRVFADPSIPLFPKADLEAALKADCFSFAIEANVEKEQITLQAISADL